MPGRGPRVGAVGLVGLLGVVLAFLVTMSLPFLGLPWFIIAAVGIGGARYGLPRPPPVPLLTHKDNEAVTKNEGRPAAGPPYGVPPPGGRPALPGPRPH